MAAKLVPAPAKTTTVNKTAAIRPQAIVVFFLNLIGFPPTAYL
jgi:hypothetical protein